jgi:O-antigen ligase
MGSRRTLENGMLSAQSMLATTDPRGPAIARAAGRPVRPTRPRSWTRIIWAYLLGATILTTLIAVDPDTATAAAAAGGVMILLFGWFARLESLFLMLILVLPFDALKPLGVLSLSNALLIVVVVKSLLFVPIGRLRIRRSLVYAPLVIFAAAVVVSSMGALPPPDVDAPSSWRLSATVFSGMAIVLAAVNLCGNVRALWRAMAAVLLAGIFVALVSVVQLGVYWSTGQALLTINVFGLVNLGIDVPHPASVFESEAVMGIYLIPATVFAVTRAQAGRERGGGPRYVLAAGLLLIASLFTFSRGLIVTYAVGLPVLLFAHLSWSRRARRLAAIALLPMLIFGAWKTMDYLKQWNPASTYSRLAILYGGLTQVRAHPWFGTGLGSRVYPIAWNGAEQFSGVDATLELQDAITSTQRDLHNTFASLLVDTGLVGLTAFLWLLWRILKEGRRWSIRHQGGWRRTTGRAVLGACLMTLGGILFNGVLGVKAVWLILGLTAAAGSALTHDAQHRHGTAA